MLRGKSRSFLAVSEILQWLTNERIKISTLFCPQDDPLKSNFPTLFKLRFSYTMKLDNVEQKERSEGKSG